MPRFVDRKAVVDLDLGPCECPVEPKPHENDSVQFRQFQSYVDWLAIVDAGSRGMEDYNRVRLTHRIKAWNLRDENNNPVPVTAATIADLDQATANKIHGFLNDIDSEENVELPNA